MNHFWQLKTVIKTDYYGQPYEARVVKEPDLGNLWQAFKERQAIAEAYKAKYRVREWGGNYLRHQENEQVKKETE